MALPQATDWFRGSAQPYRNGYGSPEVAMLPRDPSLPSPPVDPARKSPVFLNVRLPGQTSTALPLLLDSARNSTYPLSSTMAEQAAGPWRSCHAGRRGAPTLTPWKQSVSSCHDAVTPLPCESPCRRALMLRA